MNPLPRNCIAAAVLAVVALVAGPAQAQRSTSEGSSLYSPPASPGAEADAERKAPAKAAPTKSGNRGTAKAAPESRRASIALPLTGRWQDPGCVPLTTAGSGQPLFVQRAYEFDEKTHQWTLAANVFGSDRCSADARLLTYEGSGTYEVTGRSRLGNDVYEATFTMKGWQATSLSRSGTLALFNARCGTGVFDEGAILDLSRSGCSLLNLQPLAVAGSGRELLKLDDGKLFLGPAPAIPNQGDERPARVGGFGLTKL